MRQNIFRKTTSIEDEASPLKNSGENTEDSKTKRKTGIETRDWIQELFGKIQLALYHEVSINGEKDITKSKRPVAYKKSIKKVSLLGKNKIEEKMELLWLSILKYYTDELEN